jgi:hypothetical protein
MLKAGQPPVRSDHYCRSKETTVAVVNMKGRVMVRQKCSLPKEDQSTPLPNCHQRLNL